jgi:hypothetical protein
MRISFDITHADAERLVTAHADLLFWGDSNFVGELLRAISYPDDNEVGGYTGREVRPDAAELTGAEAKALIDAFFDYDYDADDPEEVKYHDQELTQLYKIAHVYRFQFAQTSITLINYWSGDATLLFYFNKGAEVRVIENNDCKKTDRWSDCPIPQVSDNDLTDL